MFNINMLRRVFSPEFQLHDIKQTSCMQSSAQSNILTGCFPDQHAESTKNIKTVTKLAEYLPAGLLAKPFLLASSNEAAAADAMSQLLTVCLGKRLSHLPGLLADIIAVVTTAAAATTPVSEAAAATTSAVAASDPAVGAAASVISEAALSMLDAVAGKLSPDSHSSVHHADGKQHQQQRARSKDATLNLAQQQESAVHALLAYASRGMENQKTVLGLHLCKVPAFPLRHHGQTQ